MEHPTDRPAATPAATAARHAVFGFGVREIGAGVVALAVLVAAGLLLRSRSSRGTEDLRQVRAELVLAEQAASEYRQKLADLQAHAAELRQWSDAQHNEPLRTWARERARRFDFLVSRVNRDKEARMASAGVNEIALLCSRGDVEAAQARLRQLPRVEFPDPQEFERLKRELYDEPLAQFSRQTPDHYRALRQFEPGIAKRDEAALRSEILAAGNETATPQLMLQVELLAAVAAPDDPVVAEWSALASAIDYFESPDAATIAAWRSAQQAMRAGDWGRAASQMQSILKTKVRTRQPFRAAYGRALLRSRPDDASEAYPFLAEAAAAGDRQARSWVAQEDYRQGRYPQAKRWVESAISDGDLSLLPVLLELHEKHADDIQRDPARDAGVLERVVDAPDAPPAASLLLGRMYERGDVPGASPKKAFVQYSRAAAKGSAAANAEVARCAMNGIGTPPSVEQARDAACRAYAGGEVDKAIAVLSELMSKAPEKTAGAVQEMFEKEQVGSGGGYTETRIVDGPGVKQLKLKVAQYFDRTGMFGPAARMYSNLNDPAAARRNAELTRARACSTCGGQGRIQVPTACPICRGEGKQVCSVCAGSGSVNTPGMPPCTICGGAGSMIQNRKVVACATCGGSGKGKGNMIKQDCTQCDGGHIRCGACQGGSIKVPKDCPDCGGRGSWSMAEKG